MPIDVKLNAEGVVSPVARYQANIDGKVIARMIIDFHTELSRSYGEPVMTSDLCAVGPLQAMIGLAIERGYLAALDNSKPTPAVVDDGLIAELRRAYPVTITDASTLIARTASALAAAHSQREADVAMIGELTEALRPFAKMDVSEIHVDPSDGRWEIHIAGPVQATFSMFERAAALAKVKP